MPKLQIVDNQLNVYGEGGFYLTFMSEYGR